MHRGGAKGCNPAPIRESIQDSGYELRRIPLPRTRLKKGKAEDRGIMSPSSLPTSKRPRAHTGPLRFFCL
jgi:hypothetical protein